MHTEETEARSGGRRKCTNGLPSGSVRPALELVSDVGSITEAQVFHGAHGQLRERCEHLILESLVGHRDGVALQSLLELDLGG